MKKNLKSGLVAAAAVAIGAVGGLAPQATECVQAVKQQTQVEKVTRHQNVNQTPARQAVRNTQSAAVNRVYLPYKRCGFIFSDWQMIPKQYGIYLLRSGKNKYNDRCRHHERKMHS